MHDVRAYLEAVKGLVDTLVGQVEPLIDLMYRAYQEGRTVFIIGNGGSASNASHFAQDLAKGTLPHMGVTKRIRALALTDNVSFMTALSNDIGYEVVFEEQVKTYARPGDVLVAFSGSGNSKNILRAVEWANSHGLTTVGITGFDGGRLHQIAQVKLHVPCYEMGAVESLHCLAFHWVVLALRRRIATERGHEHGGA
ncbi:MAG: SIS domain-containing protein [Dehalococcoidia bacterium]|nr:SIS domain-containing protein [Dehalococcoidia bacterium]MDW8119887.1 SIS domain-containing protein [Chloroflexota bacterium]